MSWTIPDEDKNNLTELQCTLALFVYQLVYFSKKLIEAFIVNCHEILSWVFI